MFSLSFKNFKKYLLFYFAFTLSIFALLELFTIIYNFGQEVQTNHLYSSIRARLDLQSIKVEFFQYLSFLVMGLILIIGTYFTSYLIKMRIIEITIYLVINGLSKIKIWFLITCEFIFLFIFISLFHYLYNLFLYDKTFLFLSDLIDFSFVLQSKAIPLANMSIIISYISLLIVLILSTAFSMMFIKNKNVKELFALKTSREIKPTKNKFVFLILTYINILVALVIFSKFMDKHNQKYIITYLIISIILIITSLISSLLPIIINIITKMKNFVYKKLRLFILNQYSSKLSSVKWILILLTIVLYTGQFLFSYNKINDNNIQASVSNFTSNSISVKNKEQKEKLLKFLDDENIKIDSKEKKKFLKFGKGDKSFKVIPYSFFKKYETDYDKDVRQYQKKQIKDQKGIPTSVVKQMWAGIDSLDASKFHKNKEITGNDAYVLSWTAAIEGDPRSFFNYVGNDSTFEIKNEDISKYGLKLAKNTQPHGVIDNQFDKEGIIGLWNLFPHEYLIGLDKVYTQTLNQCSVPSENKELADNAKSGMYLGQIMTGNITDPKIKKLIETKPEIKEGLQSIKKFHKDNGAFLNFKSLLKRGNYCKDYSEILVVSDNKFNDLSNKSSKSSNGDKDSQIEDYKLKTVINSSLNDKLQKLGLSNNKTEYKDASADLKPIAFISLLLIGSIIIFLLSLLIIKNLIGLENDKDNMKSLVKQGFKTKSIIIASLIEKTINYLVPIVISILTHFIFIKVLAKPLIKKLIFKWNEITWDGTLSIISIVIVFYILDCLITIKRIKDNLK